MMEGGTNAIPLCRGETMLKRKVILSRDSVLWYAGDPAVSLAIVESGKLGVRTDKGLVGIVRPNMVLGDSSILALAGGTPKRLATIYALEEGTTVVEYPPSLVKEAADEQGRTVWRAILTMLLGQVCRNGLVLMSAHQDRPFLAQPFRSPRAVPRRDTRGLLRGDLDLGRLPADVPLPLRDARLHGGRPAALTGPLADRDLLEATEATRDFFQGLGRFPSLVDHIEAARERWAREESPGPSSVPSATSRDAQPGTAVNRPLATRRAAWDSSSLRSPRMRRRSVSDAR